jgi:hypothetical protein
LDEKSPASHVVQDAWPGSVDPVAPPAHFLQAWAALELYLPGGHVSQFNPAGENSPALHIAQEVGPLIFTVPVNELPIFVPLPLGQTLQVAWPASLL